MSNLNADYEPTGSDEKASVRRLTKLPLFLFIFFVLLVVLASDLGQVAVIVKV